MAELDQFQLEQQRERLVLLCALDRAHLRLRLAHAAQAAESPLAPLPLVRDILQVTRLLPGAPGRWSRRFSLLGDLLQTLR